MKKPWFERWSTSGWKLADVDDAVDLVTAFVVGFVIEEQERRQAAETDPDRYSIVQREAWRGGGVALVKDAAHLHDEGDQRFERQLGIVLDGLAAHLDG
ncbi:hypothetical protein FHS29_006987 [Saccharothrix tamanrassetensis]|uniref:Tetracycline repressor TetR C-terminal domain-containing protein n=1 Tax=Saccharothrix tamanrassetensis TaxID=1051531 RepID=A0A841CVM8_9PSEU|nr:TetR/AcrR family transcriptional regulator C-terminal domain-containing protein [Saccharothrix tamanrassetensis]MBB5960364.1 hypothetical protein [Saccharothrix tamanrassetensis]